MNDLAQLLYSALLSPYGIEVQTSNPELLRQKLYPLRKADPELSPLSFIIPPTNPTELLWIIKKG